MPARPIWRRKQGVWERQGSWAKWAARREKVSACTMRSYLVPVTPHLALHPELCSPSERVMFPSDRQSSSTVSPNSQEVVYHNQRGLWNSGNHFVRMWMNPVSNLVSLFFQMPAPWCWSSTAAKPLWIVWRIWWFPNKDQQVKVRQWLKRHSSPHHIWLNLLVIICPLWLQRKKFHL